MIPDGALNCHNNLPLLASTALNQRSQRGMKYFTQFNCIGCHADNGGGMGPALSNSIFKYGGEPANIYLTIAHGRPLGMPSWGALLPDDVIWDLVSYVQSLLGRQFHRVLRSRRACLLSGERPAPGWAARVPV